MNILPSCLQELARGNRLFVGLCKKSTTSQSSSWLEANAFSFVRVSAGDVAEAIKAVKWVTGSTFTEASPGVDGAQSCVVNSSGQVFACLYSPQAPSTVQPVVATSPEVTTSDGYVWRHLFMMTSAQRDKFHQGNWWPTQTLRPAYVAMFKKQGLPAAPVMNPRLTLDPVIAGVSTSAIQDASSVIKAVRLPAMAVKYSEDLVVKIEDPASTGAGATLALTLTAGAITAVAVTDQGSSYTQAVVTVIGDGTGAQITVTVSAGKVVAAQIVAGGSAYTKARAVVTAGADSSAVEAVYPDARQDYNLSAVLISKSIQIIDPAGEQELTPYFFISAEPEPSAMIRGAKGSAQHGVEKKVGMTAWMRVGDEGAYSLRENNEINTIITVP